MIPRQYFVIFSTSVCVIRRVNTAFFKGFKPYIKLEMLAPAVEFAAHFPRCIDNIAESSVALCKNSFKPAYIGIVIADLDFLGFYGIKEQFLLSFNFLTGILRLKLERSDRLWYECGTAYSRPVLQY